MDATVRPDHIESGFIFLWFAAPTREYPYEIGRSCRTYFQTLGKTRCPQSPKWQTIVLKYESAFTTCHGTLYMTSKTLPLKPPHLLKAGLAVLALLAATPGHAVDFGPDGMFSLNGFLEVTTTLQGSYCLQCQVAPAGASKQIRSSDAIIPGKTYRDTTLMNWQVQPDLSFQYNLGNGFKAGGKLGQRWREGYVDGNVSEVRYGGTVDVPDYWYNKNLSLSHEDYGTVTVGSMVTRGWGVADYPYGGNVGLSSAWGASGAGYGMLSNAVRVASRTLDVANGDLFVEVSYDQGNTHFTRLKPEFWELYAQYHRGDLVLDGVLQNASNGGPGAWGHAPFSSVTPFSLDDQNPALGGNHQSIAMLMARYQATSQIELTAGVRRNQWQGADLVYNPVTSWTTAFNVDFNNSNYPGYSAVSYDTMLGLRYRINKWVLSTGMVYLGEAQSGNPSERGQGNSATFNTFNANYEFGNGWLFESTLGMVHYSKKGLSPTSMPGNDSFSNVDSRISQDGRWLTLGMLYAF